VTALLTGLEGDLVGGALGRGKERGNNEQNHGVREWQVDNSMMSKG
jgi:hypothetical protein